METRHRATNMAVDFDDLFYRGRDEEGRSDALLDTEEDTMGCRDLSKGEDKVSLQEEGRRMGLSERERQVANESGVP